MTDPIAYHDGQLDVFDVIALIDDAARAEAENIEREAEIRALNHAIQHGREHPYAGVCGEDDALSDRLDALLAEEAEYLATCAGHTLSEDDEILDHDDYEGGE